jgi:hypothetical protein
MRGEPKPVVIVCATLAIEAALWFVNSCDPSQQLHDSLLVKVASQRKEVKPFAASMMSPRK